MVWRQLGVLAEYVDGLAAEGFGFVAHLGEVAALVGVEGQQAVELLFECFQGGVDGREGVGGVGEVDQVLTHIRSVIPCQYRPAWPAGTA